MTQDEIILMAREAGFISIADWSKVDKEFERFAALVAAHERKRVRTALKRAYAKVRKWAVEKEREACAKVCERLISGDGICADDGVWIHDCAAAIRARSQIRGEK